MNLVKESLAKLLAQEDLIVEHRKVDTAQFDIARRVLTLPMWEHKQSVVIDSLIAHEVGHALYTPDDWDFLDEVPMTFVNVCEDIRIEKLMKRRYEGLPKTFFGGYKVLADEDFFGAESNDVEEFNLADRMNLQYKIGNFTDVPFSEDEKVFLDEADKLETFDDVVALAKKIYAYCVEQLKKQKDEEPMKQELPLPGNSGGGKRPDLGADETEYEDQPESKTEAEEHLEQHLEQQQEEVPGGIEAGRGNGPQENKPTVKTTEISDEKLKKLVNHGAPEISYIELPKTVGKDVFISNKEVSDKLDNYYSQKEVIDQQQDYADEYDLMMARHQARSLKEIDAKYSKFKISNGKEVNYLVKEFECKKAADSYARTTVNRTGVLDTTKLHTYKYNEDLFRKISTIAEGKNHGLIFNVDWSGSMSNCITSTIKQVLTLVSFCRKVGIEYDVYCFTDSYSKRENYYQEDPGLEGQVLCHNFNMVNLLTSKSNNRAHERQAKNLFRLASAFGANGCGGPYDLSLGGTPLSEAMISMNEIIPDFKTRTGAQKVHVINLTDGEGYQIGYGKKVKHYKTDEEIIIRGRLGEGDTVLRDRKTGRTYAFDGNGYYDMTNTFIRQLRNRFPECEFINIRLINGSDWNRFKRHSLGFDMDAWDRADREWKKTKSFICLSSAYTAQFAMASGALDNDAEFEVEEGANKTQIKRAFTKSLKSKKMNKKILTSFIDRIA